MSDVWREISWRCLLNWLTDPGPSVPREVRERLADQLLSSSTAVIMGALDAIVISCIAVVLHCDSLFLGLAFAEVICGAMRLIVIHNVRTARSRGAVAPIHGAALMSIVWCTLQGMTAFFAIRSGVPTLQILSASMTMGVVGGCSARNYPAPRLAMLLVCLCDLPFIAGACTAGQPWLLVLLPMTPPFLYGVSQIISSCHTLAVASLTKELTSRDLARRDALTGLLNRHGLGEILQKVLLDHEETALLCLDLDGFKRVNDDFGHHAGDSLLKAVAARLEAGSRPGDAVVRTGGDEFIVIAKGMPPAQAAVFAQSLIGLIMSEPYKLDDCPSIWIGVSIGFACSPHDTIDPHDLHRKADAALYLSKAAGKGVYRRCGQTQPHGAIALT